MTDPDRVEGVDFADVNAAFGDISYPVSAGDLIERHGDRELARTNADPITIAELFDYLGEATFDSESELRQQILGQMPSESVGRTNYSDRGGAGPRQTADAEEAADVTSADFQPGDATDPNVTQRGG